MKPSKFACGVLIGCASFAAQADIIELKISGNVSLNAEEGVAGDVQKVTAYVVLNTKEGLPAALDYSAHEYSEAIVSVRYEFEDAQGLPLDIGLVGPFELSQNTELLESEYSFADGFDFTKLVFAYELDNEVSFTQITLAGSDTNVIAEYGSDFIFNTTNGLPPNDIAAAFVFGTPSLQPMMFLADVSELSYQVLLADADHDGIADELDACSSTDLSATVMLNGIDSGVENVLDSTGCSIADHYAACDAEQSSGAGWLGYQGASYCETQVGYDLYREGLISYMELRMLRNALR